MYFNDLMTKIREKRQAFIYVLICLLIYGLTWGSLPDVGLFEKSRGQDAENYPGTSPFCQVNQRDIAFVQNISLISLNKAAFKLSGNVNSEPYYHYNVNSNYLKALYYILDSQNTTFKIKDGQTCLRLDIPPPPAFAYL